MIRFQDFHQAKTQTKWVKTERYLSFNLLNFFVQGNFILKNNTIIEQTRNLPTRIGLDLPPLSIGTSTAKPFKYLRNNMIQLSLGRSIGCFKI